MSLNLATGVLCTPDTPDYHALSSLSNMHLIRMHTIVFLLRIRFILKNKNKTNMFCGLLIYWHYFTPSFKHLSDFVWDLLVLIWSAVDVHTKIDNIEIWAVSLHLFFLFLSISLEIVYRHKKYLMTHVLEILALILSSN